METIKENVIPVWRFDIPGTSSRSYTCVLPEVVEEDMHQQEITLIYQIQQKPQVMVQLKVFLWRNWKLSGDWWLNLIHQLIALPLPQFIWVH